MDRTASAIARKMYAEEPETVTLPAIAHCGGWSDPDGTPKEHPAHITYPQGVMTFCKGEGGLS